jgi:hypothetical protein
MYNESIFTINYLANIFVGLFCLVFGAVGKDDVSCLRS